VELYIKIHVFVLTVDILHSYEWRRVRGFIPVLVSPTEERLKINMIKKTLLTLIIFISLFGLTHNVFASADVTYNSSTDTMTINSFDGYTSGNYYRLGIYYPNDVNDGVPYFNSLPFVLNNFSTIFGFSDLAGVWNFGIIPVDSSCGNHDNRACFSNAYFTWSMTILGGTAPDYSSAPTAITGCMDSTAFNYNSNATVDSIPTSCISKVLGCMDSSAINYNSLANTENYDCTYPINENEYHVFDSMSVGGTINKEPLFTSNTIFATGYYEIYKNWAWSFCTLSGTDNYCGGNSQVGMHRLSAYQPYFVQSGESYSTFGSYINVSTLPVGDYFFHNLQGESGLFFHMKVDGTFSKIQNNFTAIFNPTCHDGIQNQDETGIDTGGVCAVITTTHVDPFADCKGVDFVCYIKSSFQWLFTVDSSTFSPLIAQFDSVKTHVPLNYIYYVSAFWTSLANGSATTAPTLSIPIGSSSITLFSATMLSSNPVAPLVKNSLVVVLWIMLVLALYSRGVRLFHADINPMSTNHHI